MPPGLQPGESIVWRGRPAYKFRYPGLVFFSLLGVIAPPLDNPVGHGIALWSALLFLVSIGLVVFSTARYATTRYYISTKRVITADSTVDLQDISNIRIEQTMIARNFDRGDIYFDSASGRWAVFKRVRHPEAVKQGALNARSQLPMPTVECEYCGKHVVKGTETCPECGAKFLQHFGANSDQQARS